MSKDLVLVVRKPDGTIHVVEKANEASLKNLNNKKPIGQKWTFEDMERSEAMKLPFIDPNFVKPADAVAMVKDLEKSNEAKDKELEDLRNQLAALKGGQGAGTGTITDLGANAGAGADQGNDGKKVVELVPAKAARIMAAATVDEVKEILGDDDRKGVMDAAAKRMDQINNPQ